MATLSDSDRSAILGDLAWHWSGAYVLDFDGATYSASRKGYPEHVLRASTVRELRTAIRSDYFAWLGELSERSSA